MEGGSLRQSTKEQIARVVRGLRAGKEAKKIAYGLGLTHSAVKVMIHRFPELRIVFVETYHLRHPERENPPLKIINPLRTASAQIVT